MKFLHLIKRDTAEPGKQIYLNLASVNFLMPLVSGDGTAINLISGETLMVTAPYEELTTRIFNMGFGY